MSFCLSVCLYVCLSLCRSLFFSFLFLYPVSLSSSISLSILSLFLPLSLSPLFLRISFLFVSGLPSHFIFITLSLPKPMNQCIDACILTTFYLPTHLTTFHVLQIYISMHAFSYLRSFLLFFLLIKASHYLSLIVIGLYSNLFLTTRLSNSRDLRLILLREIKIMTTKVRLRSSVFPPTQTTQ